MASQTVTLLFTDMVGSTALSMRVDPAQADQIRHQHFSALRQALAAYDGAEVKNLGDGLMAAFSSVSGAIACAVSMQQRIDYNNRSTVFPVGLRIGVSCGEATKEDDDFFGEPVVLAARLCAAAAGGEVFVADMVKVVAGRRSTQIFESVGEILLKGIPEPVAVHKVRWEPLAEIAGSSVLPLSGRVLQRSQIGVVGREHELSRLADVVKAVTNSGGREVVLVAGEPGQGKSALVAEAARRAHQMGVSVLWGSCDEDLGAPYRPFHEALGHLVIHLSEDQLIEHTRTYGGALLTIAPGLHQRLPDLSPPRTSDAETERYMMYNAVVGLFAQISEEQSIILVLDDVHWADRPSLQLLRYLVENTATSRVLIIAIFRDAELSTSHPLTEALARLRRQDGISNLQVRGLDDLGVQTFLEQAAGHRLDEAGVSLAQAVYQETDGNPFFVTEVLRHLTESGAIVKDDSGRWAPARLGQEIALPDSVRQVIAARVSRVGEAATQALTAASVIGRDFDLPLLTAVTGMDIDELLDLLDDASRAALVVESHHAPERYRFAHALIQHTLYDDLGMTRKARLHRRVAEALEQLPNGTDRTSELARHWLLAVAPQDVDKALGYAQRAAEQALANLAPHDARDWYEKALNLLDGRSVADQGLRCELLIGLGDAERQCGYASHRETLLSAANMAIAIGDRDLLVRSALANTRGFFAEAGQIDDARVGVLETAVRRFEGLEGSNRARLLGLLAAELTFDADHIRRRTLADEALAVARGTGNIDTQLAVLNFRVVAIQAPDTLTEVLANSHEAITLAEQIQNPILQAFAAGWRYFAAWQAANRVEADRMWTIMTETGGRLGQPTMLWMIRWLDAQNMAVSGRLAEAEQLAEDAFAIGTETGQPDAFGIYGMQILRIARERDLGDSYVSLLEDYVNIQPKASPTKAMLARLYCDQGRFDEARRVVQPFIDSRLADVDWNVYWMSVAAAIADTVADLQWVDAVPTLLELLGPYAEQWDCVGPSAMGPASRPTARLSALAGHWDRAEYLFRQSLETTTSAGTPLYQAHVCLDWGRSQLMPGSPGGRQEARERFSQAIEIADRCGFHLIRRLAHQALGTGSQN